MSARLCQSICSPSALPASWGYTVTATAARLPDTVSAGGATMMRNLPSGFMVCSEVLRPCYPSRTYPACPLLLRSVLRKAEDIVQKLPVRESETAANTRNNRNTKVVLTIMHICVPGEEAMTCKQAQHAARSQPAEGSVLQGRWHYELQGHAAGLFTQFLTRYGLTSVHRACMLLVSTRCTVILITDEMRLQPLKIRRSAQAGQQCKEESRGAAAISAGCMHGCLPMQSSTPGLWNGFWGQTACQLASPQSADRCLLAPFPAKAHLDLQETIITHCEVAQRVCCHCHHVDGR